jgi:NDP-sugar pyrophosphorylase family protein
VTGSLEKAAGVEGKLRGGIIAAGEGSRLRAAGWTMPKPLVPVAGVPLLGWVVRNLVAAGVGPIVAIVNETEGDCVAWAESRFPELDLRFIVKTTASSLESFLEVSAAAGPGPLLVSTVDAWCPEGELVRFVEAARRRPADAVVLAVTPLVEDEKPLWVRMTDDGRITEVGGPAGNVVTAGLYLVPERVRRLTPPAGLARLRDFLGWLVRREDAVYGEIIETMVDVDRASDVALAESLASDGGGAG